MIMFPKGAPFRWYVWVARKISKL